MTVEQCWVMIACPAHQRWPKTGEIVSGAYPEAMLNLSNFQWSCAKCGGTGLLTRCFQPNFMALTVRKQEKGGKATA